MENLDLNKASLHQKDQAKLNYKELVEKYRELFALNSVELGCTTLIEHSIDTGDHQPIKQLPRRVPHSLRAKVLQHVQEMLEQEVVKPSHSPWASPIVLVAKKDGSTRFLCGLPKAECNHQDGCTPLAPRKNQKNEF